MSARKNKCLRFSEKESNMIKALSEELGITQTEVIVKGVFLLRRYLDKKKK